MADTVPFPFLALVDQVEMKKALILALINPRIGGVLLIGPRGTGKTTAVRGLVELLPTVRRSLCPYGCTEEAAEAWGMDGICSDCAVKMGMGEPLTAPDRMRLIELPLNARLEDVVGGVDERVALEQQKVRLSQGILARADQNLLYVDEVNLLDEAIINALLDAAAQGQYTVRRGPMVSTYRSRIVLVGSMNPEEGPLRAQILDRFGLRVVVRGLRDPKKRLLVAQRVQAYQANPYAFSAAYAQATAEAAAELAQARERLPRVRLTREAEKTALALIQELDIETHRAELVLFEAARAHAAADDREKAGVGDVRAVAPMVLRQRRSQFIADYLAAADREDARIQEAMEKTRRTRRG
ncbi:MAG: magnesium chelatase [Chloroflexi bacterium]|nr:MAG: magnesium chelatase [Chloroflexota bacterium]